MLTAPLRFQPLVKRAIWGGRRLGTALGKTLGPESDYAESWEVVDHGADQSVVAGGPWAGRTLGELVVAEGPALLGRHHPQARFPLLFKFLDCREKLSVQVHPDDARGALLDPPDLGKTEAWVVLAAEPGSLIYAGLKRGFDRAALEREVHRGTSDLCLHRFEPAVGDCLFLPAGLVHAPGAGLLIAEIQQASNTTFRLFDWNRVGPDGMPRQLHIERGLAAINYAAGPAAVQQPESTVDPRVERLVACDKFVLERVTLAPDESWTLTNDDRFHIVSVVQGAAAAVGPEVGESEPLPLGTTCLVPACLQSTTFTSSSGATLLTAYLP